jgi:hypothetical protein
MDIRHHTLPHIEIKHLYFIILYELDNVLPGKLVGSYVNA